jgi:sortase A
VFRKVLRGLGKTFIAAGVLIFLFVAYQLWGTNLAESRDQKSLKQRFNQAIAPPAAAAEPPPPSRPELGDAVALIEIPKLGLQKYVVEGVGTEDLKKGPGHYPETPMPGEPGNAAIAGHRTTYGAPFSEFDKLAAGDTIMVTTRAGTFRYDYESTTIVSPDESAVLDPTDDNRLTLTTCHPRFSAAQRMIVVAKLGSPVVEAPPPPADTEPAQPPQLAAGLSGAGSSNGPAIAWGGLAALIWALTWWVSRWWKRWAAYLLGAPLFLLVLFVFFENFSRLLPANL